MSGASHLLVSKWPLLKAKDASNAPPLTHGECAFLENLLRQEGERIAYSAMVSLGDALRGIEAGFCSWATVKLYYTVFYGLRALLAFHSFALFYVGTSPFLVLAKPGERPRHGGTSSSHKMVMNAFRREFSNSRLLSQPIAQEDPLTWLQMQRERVNYKQTKFTEPDVPDNFRTIAKAKGTRKLVAAYLTDEIYAFDPDHAILAYPIAVLRELKASPRKQGLFEELDQDALRKILTDSLGPIAAFDAIIRA